MRNLPPLGRVSVEDMAQAREARAALQEKLLLNHDTVVCLTMNIPGPKKVSPLIEEAFFEGLRLVGDALPRDQAGNPVRPVHLTLNKTGPEAFYALSANARQIKRTLVSIEDETPLGRLFDIDVLSALDGAKLSRETLGLPARKCLLCGRPAFLCARSRAHSVEELNNEIGRIILSWKRDQVCATVSFLAVQALILEAETTPKPGLVDERNNGSHPDMTLDMFRRSADALKDYFKACAFLGFDTDDLRALYTLLQPEGLKAEQAMLAATNGVNTHKGAIFSLGILCAAAAHGEKHGNSRDPRAVCRIAGSIPKYAVARYLEKLNEESAVTFGERLYVKTGLSGIRGEVADGYPSVLKIALPALERYLSLSCSLKDAGARALIHLLAQTKDTTLVKRGGLERAGQISGLAKQMLEGDMSRGELCALDDLFIRENLTCGGCADLLACTYFLYLFSHAQDE